MDFLKDLSYMFFLPRLTFYGSLYLNTQMCP